MKRPWIRFWLFASLIALAVSVSAASQKSHKRGVGANELTLGGIQPGKDKLSGIQKLLDEHLHAMTAEGANAHGWNDPCTGRLLTLEVDGTGVIQTVDINSSTTHENCKAPRDEKKESFWVTGEGLKLGESSERVVEIYGPPSSSGPSIKQGRELELMFYMFDWAGSKVPQVMEVTCDKSDSRVVEIMLAFPSL